VRITTRPQAGDIWTAVDESTYDGPLCPIGVGRSEAAAIADLMDQLDERAREFNDAVLQDACDRQRGREP
jgi:hypothetical protein